ncbi:hypothetical protein BK142_23620 [Paenibacillus glucanolyticus]|nr:hypothetical protein BK142_23620 [Paenibacillus glucanolyticus]
MRQLQEALRKLEGLQETRKRNMTNGVREVMDFIDYDLHAVIDNLKDVQNELETKNDHSCNCSH